MPRRQRKAAKRSQLPRLPGAPEERTVSASRRRRGVSRRESGEVDRGREPPAVAGRQRERGPAGAVPPGREVHGKAPRGRVGARVPPGDQAERVDRVGTAEWTSQSAEIAWASTARPDECVHDWTGTRPGRAGGSRLRGEAADDEARVADRIARARQPRDRAEIRDPARRPHEGVGGSGRYLRAARDLPTIVHVAGEAAGAAEGAQVALAPSGVPEHGVIPAFGAGFARHLALLVEAEASARRAGERRQLPDRPAIGGGRCARGGRDFPLRDGGERRQGRGDEEQPAAGHRLPLSQPRPRPPSLPFLATEAGGDRGGAASCGAGEGPARAAAAAGVPVDRARKRAERRWATAR
jgi:hypothetical protein